MSAGRLFRVRKTKFVELEYQIRACGLHHNALFKNVSIAKMLNYMPLQQGSESE